MRSEGQSDDACLRGLASDDARAFDILFDRYSDFVYNVAFRRTSSWSAAEDITEIVFMELWRQRHRVMTYAGSLRPWLAGVAANQSRRWWRDNTRKNRAVERLGVRVAAESHQDDVAERASSKVDDEQQMRLLLNAVADLPDDQRDVLTLWAWEQLSYEEIAAALHVPVGTVRSRLSRARARLRDFEVVVAVDGGDELPGGTVTPLRASPSEPPTGAAEAKPRCTDGGE